MAKASSIIKGNWAYIAMMTSAELAARLADMKDTALTMLAGIAADKNLLMGGQATQRVEHVMAPAADQWSDFVSGLRSAQVIDVTPEPVGTVSAEPQKAAALPAPVIEIETEPLQ
jgi:hypothetical protein